MTTATVRSTPTAGEPAFHEVELLPYEIAVTSADVHRSPGTCPRCGVTGPRGPIRWLPRAGVSSRYVVERLCCGPSLVVVSA